MKGIDHLKRVALFLLVASCNAQTYIASGNFATDLVGTQDTRQNTWGRADYVVYPVKFQEQGGKRIQIVSVRGDAVAWIKSLPGDPPTPPESASGVLVSFSTTAPDGSTRCDYCADNCILYVQGVVTEKQPSMRAPFSETGLNTVLPDGVLNAKVASWLNTTGKPIHIELTYTIRFRYVNGK